MYKDRLVGDGVFNTDIFGNTQRIALGASECLRLFFSFMFSLLKEDRDVNYKEKEYEDVHHNAVFRGYYFRSKSTLRSGVRTKCMLM